MRVLFVYNPNNSQEVSLIDGAMVEMSSYIEQIEAVDFNLVREQFKIRETPALVIIRDDLQGLQLLDKDETGNQLHVTAELLKAMEEEDLNFHQQETHRIDYLIVHEANAKTDAVTLEMLTRAGV
jgi:hypothetical protein